MKLFFYIGKYYKRIYYSQDHIWLVVQLIQVDSRLLSQTLEGEERIPHHIFVHKVSHCHRFGILLVRAHLLHPHPEIEKNHISIELGTKQKYKKKNHIQHKVFQILIFTIYKGKITYSKSTSYKE